ncbi:TonB-dependent receptor [uncultured Maribacter sp.]|uniref:TonB-dependent receptor n=1 Tax=uncultured Maribacter sp. TaxID=431308 RepID=UPI0030ED9C1E|tara:strand:- start:18099 stop:21455 length:3357 start_codon:yes stop_codon:yes gene_type:complete
MKKQPKPMIFLSWHIKYHLKMKLSLLFFMTISFAMLANSSYSQKAKISLNKEDATVREVIDEIETTTEFKFLFSTKAVDLNRKVTIKIKKASIQTVLKLLFEEGVVSYEIDNRKVLLKRNELYRKPKIELPKLKEKADQSGIKGNISDVNGQPLTGASVVEKGTTNGVTADFDGNFLINITDENAILVISYLGFATKEISLNGQVNINVVLEESAAGLEEVVVVGYGTMKKADLTGSVSQVKSETLESVPVFNMEQALKVGASGVRVSQNSGTPGSRIEVRIRGGNSLIGDNQPLYVVDGFPVTGGIDFLNPADIESVDILKDASATAIYGSRGANGVVIITSKRGKKGQESKVEINSFFGMQQAISRYDLLDAKEYATVANEWLKNEGLNPFFNVSEIQNPGTDWWDAIFRTSPVQNHTVTFSGSSDKGRYSISGNYYDQEGIIENSGVTRGSVRVNLDQELKSWLKMGINIQLSRNEINSVNVDNGNRGTSMLSAAASAPPTLPLYNEDGLPTQIEQAYNFGSADMRNPLLNTLYKDQDFSNSILANSTFDFQISPNLSFKTLLGLQYRNARSEGFTPVIYENDRGSASEGNSYSNSFLTENVLTYSKVLNEKHSLNIIGGATYQTNTDRNSYISVSGFANNITENFNLGAAETIGNPSSGYSDWTLGSFLSRVNYIFDGKYMLTASIRADGSSRFGAKNKWGYFPSAAVAWRLSDETFLEDSATISNLKLRASYGITGNTALNPYQSLDRLNPVKYIYENQTDVIGFFPTGISNSELKWETTGQLDVGFDLNLFNDRFRFVFDYYKKNTKDLLASVPLPPSVGFGSILRNLGEIQNSGIEFSIDADILRNDFKWNASAQISANQNKVIELAGDSDIFGSDQGAVWPSANIARVGEPLGAFYGLLEDGLDENGFIKYQDVSGPDGVADGVINTLDRVILGSYHPDFIYGITSNFSFKGVELNVILEGVQGNELFNATNGTHLNSFQRGNNQFKDIIGNYWTAENPDSNAKYPKISSATQITVSDRFIEDASYLRVKSMRLAYNFPVSEIGLNGFDMAQLYVSGTNLFTFTNYSGIDPEANTRGTDSSDVGDRLRFGHDQSSYPSAKIYAIGLKFRF